MTFAQDILTAHGGLFERLGTLIKYHRSMRQERAAKNRVYHETLAELRALTERDLADIGISHSQINAIAHEAAFGK